MSTALSDTPLREADNTYNFHRWQDSIRSAVRATRSATKSNWKLPLVLDDTGADEVIAATEVLLSGQLSMSRKVDEFEKEFAAYVGAPYAVMVNSGSSANLLALAAATNNQRRRHLRPGDEVLVPAVCWSTSVWPIVQMGLKPVFVDVIPETMNIDINDFRSKINCNTRGVVFVHVLGNSANMDECLEIAREHHLITIEDTCESLGSSYKGRMLGSLGEFGTYSFFFSHHMTTGEGGMVVCHTQEDYDLCRCLRAHGWSRMHSNKTAFEQLYSDVDPRFLFVNLGYNLRPMEISGAIGLVQLKKLTRMNNTRIENRRNLVDALLNHPKYRGQFTFPVESEGVCAAWFGFPIFLSEVYQNRIGEFKEYLTNKGIDNRPIVSGNFVRQPALAKIGIAANPEDYPGAEQIHHRGLFVGLHAQQMSGELVAEIADIILSFF